MSEPTLTDAVIQAVTFADTLIRHHDWYSQGLGSLLRTEVEALERSIRAGNALVERAGEFRNHYPTIPDPVANESAPSFHELGRKLAMRVFQGIVSAAWEAEVQEAAARNAEHLDIRCRPKQLDQCYGPEQFDAILGQWPAVQVYLRDEALRFDSNRLVANIQDEAAKAAQRLKLRAGIGGQPGGDGNGQPQADQDGTGGQREDGGDNDPDRPSKEALALAVLADHPDWSDTKIAKKAGCNRTTLYTFKKFMAAREILRQGKNELPRGSKFPDKGIEAWNNEDDG